MRLVSIIAIAIGVGIVGYQLAPKRPTLLEVEWMQDADLWRASEIATTSGEYCICPPYECASMFETTLLVNDRKFFGTNSRYLLASPSGPVSTKTKPMRIASISSKQKCFEMNKGDEVAFELRKAGDSFSLSVY
ncbi:MAG: hypothetical protein MK208_02730 [Shimia sp.]|uniref:hypothetical protein n=1 Tax=Shimia sp. TaxID=1954381 RepID=UPI0025DDEBA3|nr:hypothetical protein [Shimia sp.]MCH2066126.1 hypothetical protein [Shimia sp.]